MSELEYRVINRVTKENHIISREEFVQILDESIKMENSTIDSHVEMLEDIARTSKKIVPTILGSIEIQVGYDIQSNEVLKFKDDV